MAGHAYITNGYVALNGIAGYIVKTCLSEMHFKKHFFIRMGKNDNKVCRIQNVGKK